MIKLPKEVIDAWETKDGAVVLSTVDDGGTPNSIYATCAGLYKETTIVIANNYFDKTLKNIKNGSKGSALFITKEGKAYQLKGSLTYYTEGPVFEFMKEWNPEEHPGHGAAAIEVESAYSGAKKLV